MKHRIWITGFFCLLHFSPAYADEDDTRRLLDKVNHHIQLRGQENLPAEILPQGDALVTINGQTYRVDNNAEDLKTAIYVAMNLQQWVKVRELTERYRLLPEHEAAVALLAEGMLARAQQNHTEAITKLRASTAADPNVDRTRLELARVLFEDNQTREARTLFTQMLNNTTLPEQTRPLIRSYLDAVDSREAWHGSLSFGTGWNSNINQENGSSHTSSWCTPLFGCITTTRSMPPPISSAMFSYSGVLSKQYALGGHHQLSLRGLSYGRIFKRHKTSQEKSALPNVYYNDNTTAAYMGYRYADARNTVELSPFWENYYSDRHNKYHAYGWQLEIHRKITQKWAMRTQWQQKYYRYSKRDRQYFSDYVVRSIAFQPSYLWNDQTLLYGGITHTRRKQPLAQASNREWMVNAGIYKMFSTGINLNISALYRHTRHDAADGYLGKLRRDRQQVYLLGIDVPRYKFSGMVPSLLLKHVNNHSNIPWAYNYKQHEISLRLERTF